MATPMLTISLRNHTTSKEVFAYVTALDSNNGNKAFFLQSDGATLFYPSSPAANGSPIPANIGIQLPPPGGTRTIKIPTYFAGGRIYFSIGAQLTFLLNPGPGLVEPSPSNPSDPNINLQWDFMELSYNSSQVYANITYVDFFSVPIAITLYPVNGQPQHVSGTTEGGLSQVVAGIQRQQAADQQGWNQLIYLGTNGAPLRVLSPNLGIVMNSALFSDYYTDYVNQSWQRFGSTPMTINTQVGYGNVNGNVVNGGPLVFPGTATAPGSSFSKPSTRDIFSCSTGPFATGQNTETNAIIPRLAAAFNRSTLLLSNQFPNGSIPAQFYKSNPTNHYSRIVHEANIDGRGYAFPYDDVTNDGGVDNSGSVFGQPELLIVAVGGIGAGLAPAPIVPLA